MAADDQLAGMNEEGLRRVLGELLQSNRGAQANFEKIGQQFPIQPKDLSDAIPDFSELEEGGLMFMGPEGPESLGPGEEGQVLEAYEADGQKRMRWGSGGGGGGGSEALFFTDPFFHILEWSEKGYRSDYFTMDYSEAGFDPVAVGLNQEGVRIFTTIVSEHPLGTVYSLQEAGTEEGDAFSRKVRAISNVEKPAGTQVFIRWTAACIPIL